jgi:hypothetical protein
MDTISNFMVTFSSAADSFRMIEVVDSTHFDLDEVIPETFSSVSANLEQAYLGDIAGSVPNHYNKARHANFGFPVHIKVMFTLYCNVQ